MPLKMSKDSREAKQDDCSVPKHPWRHDTRLIEIRGPKSVCVVVLAVAKTVSSGERPSYGSRASQRHLAQLQDEVFQA